MKVQESINLILERFQKGDLPKALAPIFLKTEGTIPSKAWSYNNRLIQAMNGTVDARGFKSWINVGRCVMKGKKAFMILAPNKVQYENDEGEKVSFIKGFRGTPVFRIEDTEIVDEKKWEKHAPTFESLAIEELPLVEVAKAWDLEITTGGDSPYLGFYVPGQRINLNVKNLSTWTHELVHAADYKNGFLTKNKKSAEITAEVGGAVLLLLLGKETDADLGGCYEYVRMYSKDPVKGCFDLVNRICSNVQLILDTYQEEKWKELELR